MPKDLEYLEAILAQLRSILDRPELQLDDRTCYHCGCEDSCPYAYAEYNTDSDCLAEK